MKRKVVGLFIVVGLLFSACQATQIEQEVTKETYSVQDMKERLLTAASGLSKSENLYYENGFEITGMGATYDGRPKAFDGCFYFPAIEAMTGVHVSIDWHDVEHYSSAVAATLLATKTKMPDIISPVDFGIMDLADDGHIYTIPSVSTIQGSFSMMVRQDWLKKLGMEVPKTWEEWLAYWRGVRDHDMNANKDEYMGTYRIGLDEEIHFYQFKYLRIGETDHVIVGFQNIDKLVATEQERIENERKMTEQVILSNTDELTKLANRRAYEEEKWESKGFSKKLSVWLHDYGTSGQVYAF